LRKPLSIDPARSALLCVDLQEEHRKDGRYLVDGFDRVLDNVQRLQGTARAHGVGVYHSAYVVDVRAGTHRPFHPLMEDGRSVFSDVSDPHSAICPEVGPAGDELMLVKTDASSLAQGDVPLLLRAHGIEWLIVAGVWTEACIAATVKDAVENGFRVLVVKDACSSGSRAMHETGILNIANRLYGGGVTDTVSVCRLMAGETVDVWQVQGSVPLRFGYEDATELYASL
jgi:nicotinamidase-related amidase